MTRVPATILLLLVLLGSASIAAPLEIRPNDHICLIGNTLAERMQFEGHNHWEARLHQRFPQHKLVVRNLSWPADEVVLRPRAEGFGTPDEHLTFSRADVIIAFFGFNESFAGEKGLAGFKSDLETWIRETKARDYSGKGAPRLALVSPIAHEDLKNPHLPDGRVNNRNLALYTAAMKEVAARHGVVFADVFHPTQALYEQGQDKLTINGVHLSAAGDKEFARVLDRVLFGEEGAPFDVNGNVRREVEKKSTHWYHRYRIVDSYYVYGGRSGLKFADGDQTNRDVMQREREVLDVMCANRDERIWRLAQGQKVAPEPLQRNLPPFLEVQTSFGVNRKTAAGPNTGQTSKTAEGESAGILPSAETMKRFKLAPGYAINLYASEEDFPELGNAVSLAFDARGRMYVPTMPSYPQWRPGDPMDDRVLILDDSDGDGKADYCTTFAGGLQCPIGIELADGGVIVNNQREVLFLKDTDGDDAADVKEVILSGFDSADSHHVINAFTYGPGGDLYFQEGTFHHTQVETPYGPVRCKNAGTYRYEPRSHKLDVFVSYNYANPHGIAFNPWGQTFISDASGGVNYFATAFSGHLPYPEKHSSMQPFFPKRVRPTSGCEFVSSRHFPDEAQGRFLLNNCIGVQGILQHEVKPVGSGYEGREIEPLLLSDDRNFRPVDLQFGPDGALYVIDWQDALIGHMQYSLRDPLRDKKHARIWRITYPGRPLIQTKNLTTIETGPLVRLLEAPEIRTRERVKLELSTRPQEEVLRALAAWGDGLAANDAKRERVGMESLWLHQWLGVVNEPLLKTMLEAQGHEARAAATRVLCYWRDRLPSALALVKARAGDSHPLVRLEAVRAASFFAGQPSAANVALTVLQHPMDYYLEYTLGETMRALKPSPLDIDIAATPRALPYVLERMTVEELTAAPPVEAVFAARLERAGLDAATRDTAAVELAKIRQTTRELELAAAIKRLDDQEKDSPAAADLAKLLAASSPEALQRAGELLTRLAFKDHGVRSARLAGMAAYLAWTQKPADVWRSRQDNHETLTVLLESLVLLPDPALRAKFQPLLIEALSGALPASLQKLALAGLPLTGPEHAASNFTLLCDRMLKGQHRDTVARAALQLPRDAWNKEQAGPVVEGILAYATQVPVKQRTGQPYVEVVQFARELAGLLPPPEASRHRKALQKLGVRVFVVKTVREQMRYDTPELTVEAGRPFEIIFENQDIMPHNLVFGPPNSRTELGTTAQTMSATPDRRGNVYIPENKGIFAHSKMLEPGETQRFQVRAPTAPGTYDYVCTFPGHWMIMWGRLIVARELDGAGS
jgi:glucose/arabinose dehydrogenase/azurin